MSIEDKSSIKCWFGKGEMKWIGDFDYNEYGLCGDGVVALLNCKKCETFAEFYSEPNENKIFN